MTRISCVLRKWDGRQHYAFEADPLGSDEHGVWLGVPAGTPFEGPEYPGVWSHPFVILAPPDAWWLASFYGPGNPQDMDVYVDITANPSWPSPERFEVIDLDLDVVRFRDGRIELLDEDEFDEHRIAMAYPDPVVRRARETAESLLAAVTARVEPFAGAGTRRLEALL